jgi:hypothetical protein
MKHSTALTTALTTVQTLDELSNTRGAEHELIDLDRYKKALMQVTTVL